MKPSQTPAASTSPADNSGVPGMNLDQIARDLSNQTEAPRSALSLINADTRGVLVLFPYAPQEREEGKVYPVMKGSLDTRDAKVRVSAFAHKTDEGREYLSLSIGSAGDDHIGGALFRHELQNPLNGLLELAPGKENERFGAIAKSVPGAEPGTYDNLFQLRFRGKRKLSPTGVAYIKCNVYPERKEGADALAAMNECF